ncbi:hypothetical protein [Polaribacter staleyi]|uniref:hypothetical protein n=1 Tax=Polaribacter staleyi TaxID=2022337 RepID=UPI0031BABA1D
MKKIFTIKNVILGILFILLDLVVYIFLGIAMMDYDDFYEESKGEYMSLESMDTFQKSIFISMNIWNIINILLVIFIIYKVYKHFTTIKQIHD